MRQSHKRERGQSLIEAALGLPLLLLVLMGIVNVALYSAAGMNASNAAHYGARRASVAQTNVQAKALNYTEAKLAEVPIGTYEVTVSGGGVRGALIEIEVRYAIPNYLHGLLSLFNPAAHDMWIGSTVSYFRQEGW